VQIVSQTAYSAHRGGLCEWVRYILEKGRYTETQESVLEATGIFLLFTLLNPGFIGDSGYLSSCVETQSTILPADNEISLHFLVLRGLFVDATLS